MQKHPVIGMVMATMLEAKPFVTHTPLNKISQDPFSVYRNEHTIVIISGIGKANAAMAAFHCCKEFSPDLIVNAGAAGAVDQMFPLGGCYHINRIVEYDRPDFATGGPTTHSPNTIDGFQTATLATQDKPVILADERKKMAEVTNLVDMEAASVVQACKKQHTPCLVFKYVTDTPEHTEDGDIVNHIRQFRKPFYDFFINSVVSKLNQHLPEVYQVSP
jgi:adenosylhomocysteine nucleosidase